MISQETRARILRLHFAEQWPIGTVARELGVHHDTVRRVLAQAGVQQALQSPRPSKADPYLGFMLETLRQHPDLRASRLYQMVKERGYDGRPDHFRSIVARLRPGRPAEAFLRLRTLPGEQGQVDWAHFGQVQVGRVRRKLYGFVLVLSWSRRIFLRFGYDIGMPGFIRSHVQALATLGGVPRVLLYDNLKSAVLERVGDAIRFHPTLLELAGHYRYEPRPVAPRRGNEKGRVERAIQYIRHAFFAARAFTDLADLNTQADAWCLGEAQDRRCPEDKAMTVRQAFEHEQPRLMALPGDPFPDEERKEVTVGKTPYVRFDLNDYSVPHDLTQRRLTVLATLDRVRVLDGSEVVAEHPRCFDADEQVENREHIQRLEAEKRNAREHRSQDRLLRAGPASRVLLERMGARGGNLGSGVAALVRLLDHYGQTEVQAAVLAALDQDGSHPGAVRQVLEGRRHQRNLPQPVAITVPEKVRNVTVQPHSLSDYDRLTGKENPDA
jgi:transposase